jgi:hypothetical protein
MFHQDLLKGSARVAKTVMSIFYGKRLRPRTVTLSKVIKQDMHIYTMSSFFALSFVKITKKV